MGIHPVVLDYLSTSCRMKVYIAGLSRRIDHKCKPRSYAALHFSPLGRVKLTSVAASMISLPATSPRAIYWHTSASIYACLVPPPPPPSGIKRLRDHPNMFGSFCSVGTSSLMLLRRQFNFLHDIPHPSTLPTPLLTMDIHTIIATSIASQMSTVNNVWRLRRQPPTVARLVFFHGIWYCCSFVIL